MSLIITFTEQTINNNTKTNKMTAKISHSEPGKIQVFTKETLKGRGIKLMSTQSNGDFRYLFTEKAYEKIENQCNFVS